ncbi:hypothetical protein GOV14_02590 [Candidatus Pacearchaeota archaeon]|nr:hypothetical protein [Candidatus Pacearchaeota archaeon]
MELFESLKYVTEPQKKLRQTNQGLFIKGGSLSEIVQSHVAGLRRGKINFTDKKKMVQKWVKKLTPKSGLHYLVENDFCWTGYIIPVDNQKYPKSNGKILSCKDHFILQDPLFKKSKLFRPPKKENCIATVNFEGQEYQIAAHALDSFYNRSNNPEVSKTPTKKETTSDYKSQSYYDMLQEQKQEEQEKQEEKLQKNKEPRFKTKRDALYSLFELLKRSVPVIRKNKVKQIITYGFKDAEYRYAKKWIFVIEDGNVLGTCYQKDNLLEAGYKLKK